MSWVVEWASRTPHSKIAIDMHLRNYRVVRQIDSSMPQPAQKFAPQAFYPWLEKQRQFAERVMVCYEAGCRSPKPGTSRTSERFVHRIATIVRSAGVMGSDSDRRSVVRKLRAMRLCEHGSTLSSWRDKWSIGQPDPGPRPGARPTRCSSAH